MYALSDIKEDPLSSACDHAHDQYCMQCESLKDALQRMESCFAECSISQEELDDLMYSFHQAVQSIESWKAHQLRSTRRDEARTCMLESLDDNSVHVTQDWAMKFLPQRYRESQSDWFAKRGISWHISVVARKIQERFQHQAFVHLVENCKQDSFTVVPIIEDTLCTLRKEHPELTTAFLRQDNAGCYHCAEMLASCEQMKSKTGIAVKRVDFSDPQGEKGHVTERQKESRDMLKGTSTRVMMSWMQLISRMR